MRSLFVLLGVIVFCPADPAHPAGPELTPDAILNLKDKDRDPEGLAFVDTPKPGFFVATDDDGEKLVYLDAQGAFDSRKLPISAKSLGRSKSVVGGGAAGVSRLGDMESVVYDSSRPESLLVFSGKNKSKPAVFMLKRSPESCFFEPDKYQDLNEDWDFSGAMSHPELGILVGQGRELRSYSVDSNQLGKVFWQCKTPIFGLGLHLDKQRVWILCSKHDLYLWDPKTGVQASYDLSQYEFEGRSRVDRARGVEHTEKGLFIVGGLSNLEPRVFRFRVSAP